MHENSMNLPTHNRYKKGESGRAGRGGFTGRIAGFKHFSAQLFAAMLDSRVDEKGQILVDKNGLPDPSGEPFVMVALKVYMRRVIEAGRTGKGEALFDLMDRVLPNLEEVDRLLLNQRSSDLRFMSYSIFRYCFDEQQQLLMTKKPSIVMICGRRAGKTTAFAAHLVDRSINHDKGIGLYVGRTAKSAFDMIWRPVIDILGIIGMPYEPHIANQTIELSTGVRIMVRGRDSKADIENLRGNPYFLSVIDEVQSDPPDKLRMLVREVLEPAGKDFEDSQIVMGGTPSRIPGNYAEEIFQGNGQDVARLNWNLSVNPHLPKSERNLEKTRTDKGFAPTDPTWLREYMGVVGSYDTEALVFRLQGSNHFQESDLVTWISGQPITDIFLAGGLDYGFDDFDSAVIIMASESKGERFLLAEYKGNRQSTQQFGDNIKLILQRILSNPILANVSKRFTWFCDTEGLGKQLTHDLAAMYGLTVAPAYQGQPDLMVEMLQDDIKAARFKVREKQVLDGKEIIGEFEQETYKIVFARDDGDHLTRRIDDAIFHPEIAKSVLYAMRYVWLKSKVKPGTSLQKV